MPRQVRIEFPGATYHVMCRGDRREDIFRDDGDREMMLATLAETVGKTGWQVHAWVWMSNHYHLVLETPEANLRKWGQCANLDKLPPVHWFNALHNRRSAPLSIPACCHALLGRVPNPESSPPAWLLPSRA